MMIQWIIDPQTEVGMGDLNSGEKTLKCPEPHCFKTCRLESDRRKHQGGCWT